MTRSPVATVCCALALFCTAACGGSSSPTTSVPDAQALLQRVVLQAADIGPGVTQERAAAQTDDELATARPDSENARAQYAAWGQMLEYNVQYSAPIDSDLVFNGKIARVMNTATLFASADGAAAALAYTRGLSASTVANFLVNDGAGAKITGTQVVKDIVFPAKGDESFVWRLTGKATFADGLTVTFVADAVFVRTGRVNGNVTAVAFGQAPKRDEVAALVDKFVERAKANG